jgi:hypothetical protein
VLTARPCSRQKRRVPTPLIFHAATISPECFALARAPSPCSHDSSPHHVVVHRITPAITMAKPSHHAPRHSRRDALTDT